MAPNLVCWRSLAISNYAKSQLSFQNGGCPDGESFYILELVYLLELYQVRSEKKQINASLTSSPVAIIPTQQIQ